MIVLLVHLDELAVRPNRIADLIPVDQIQPWATQHHSRVACVPAVERGPTFGAQIVFRHYSAFWRFPTPRCWDVLRGETVLLAGGWRSLCIRQVFEMLRQREIDARLVPEWIAPDPPQWLARGNAPWSYPKPYVVTVHN